MQSKLLTLISFLLFSYSGLSQKVLNQGAGGEYLVAKVACLSSSERIRIQDMLNENISRLKQSGVLQENWGSDKEGTYKKPTAGNFIWPLQQQANSYAFNSYYGISNYVDLDPLYPNQLLDWNCGTRTYDLNNGYNHAGIDIFLWPFPQQMQEQDMVAIIAASDGIIIGKDDGNFDKNCALGNNQWNAVYIGNSDGTICWYGHMKKNSLTSKQVGQSVSAGEYLGIVGSSGNSTGPHLHFETHNSNGEIIDPFQGPCNNIPSLWANQKPYIDPSINAVLTHQRPPDFLNCPELEITNIKYTFLYGDTIVFSTYFHDQTNANPATYTITKPDGNVFDTWDHTSTQTHFNASYWYWFNIVGNGWPSGKWTFNVEYEGDHVSRSFYISDPSSIAYKRETNTINFSVVPNPNQGYFKLAGLPSSFFPATYTICNLVGMQIGEGRIQRPGKTLEFVPTQSTGIFILKLKGKNGEVAYGKFYSVAR